MTDRIGFELLQEQLPALRRFALSLTHNADSADDLLQDSLLRALVNIEKFKTGTNLRSWLFTIMHNIFCDTHRRRQRRGQQVPLEDWQDRLPQPAQQPQMIRLREVANSFDALSRDQRALLVMVGVEGHSHERAAAHFGVALGTIKSRLSRARDKLREQRRGISAQHPSRPADRVCRRRRGGVMSPEIQLPTEGDLRA